MNKFSISREIGIDMAHRVPDHRSKCKSLHGHRYKIVATCEGELKISGEQKGMVLDFGFLKEEMIDMIDKRFDHATCLYSEDHLVKKLYPDLDFWSLERPVIPEVAFIADGVYVAGKAVLIGVPPTAENLAKIWFDLLRERVMLRSAKHAKLISVTVWETPNCCAIYKPE